MSGRRPVAIFEGHTSGITSITSRDDGRYFISNSKDQSIKLWDVRYPSDPGKINTNRNRSSADYRYERMTHFLGGPQYGMVLN